MQYIYTHIRLTYFQQHQVGLEHVGDHSRRKMEENESPWILYRRAELRGIEQGSLLGELRSSLMN